MIGVFRGFKSVNSVIFGHGHRPGKSIDIKTSSTIANIII